MSDFVYTVSNASKVGINGSTLSALSAGTVSITATHKVTGLSRTFAATIYAGTFDVYIVASGISLDNMASGSAAGHGWIEIVSHSAHDFTIGYYNLPSGQTVTVGRWGSQIDKTIDGSYVGLWYDREIYEINVNEKYVNTTYSYVSVNKTTINSLSEYIKTSNEGYDLLRNNCVTFAISAWNICVDSSNTINTSIFIPSGLVNAIENLETHYSGNLYRAPGTIRCGYYNGSKYVAYNIQNN